MAIEEQTTGSLLQALFGPATAIRGGQRLTITNRVVSKLAFKCEKGGSGGAPTGDITFTIRKVSDDSLVVASKVWGDAVAIVAGAWMEVTFNTPVFVNEEVRILLEFVGGDATNWVGHYGTNTDVKADEFYTRHLDGSYSTATTWDATYRYTYEPGAPSNSGGGYSYPTEAITRVTNLIHRYNRARGVYTLEMSLGEVTSDFGLPEWLTRPQAAVPEVLEEPVVERERTKEEIMREQDSRLYREADRMRREAEERREEMLAESKEKDSRLWEANKRLKREAEEKERKLRDEVERLQATAHPLLPREGAYACPYCSAKFNTAMALTRHIESAHPRGTAYGRGIYGGGL